MLIFVAVLTMTVIKRADLRQEQIKQLASLGSTNNSATLEHSQKSLDFSLALTKDLGSTLLTSLLAGSDFTVQTIVNEEDITKQLEIGGLDFAVMELSQIVKMTALGVNLQAFFPCYTEEKSYGLACSANAKGPCRSVAYITGTPAEYYSLFLYDSPKSILSTDFKRVPVDSLDKALKLSKSGEIGGVLLDLDEELPTGFKLMAKFKPRPFYYMLVRRQRFQDNSAEIFSDSTQARLDEASAKLVKILFSLQSRVQDPGKYGLLTSQLRRSNSAILDLLNHKLSNGELSYDSQNSNISQYQDLASDILTDWKQSQEYDFSGINLNEETIRRRTFNADFASSCSNSIFVSTSRQRPTESDSAKDDTSKDETSQQPISQPTSDHKETQIPTTDSSSTPSPAPIASPFESAPPNSNSQEPISDKEIFKEEIEQGLLPDSPAVLPATPKAPPLPRQNP